jgi:hypothetical protein
VLLEFGAILSIVGELTTDCSGASRQKRVEFTIPALDIDANSLESRHGHSSIVSGSTCGRLPKMQWFGCFLAA